MAKPVGGRGKVAPYETTHVRVPVPLKPKIEKLIDDYREFIISGSGDFETHSKIPNLVCRTTLEEAKGIARNILKVRKKGAKESLALLLTALYEGTIDSKELS